MMESSLLRNFFSSFAADRVSLDVRVSREDGRANAEIDRAVLKAPVDRVDDPVDDLMVPGRVDPGRAVTGQQWSTEL